MKKQRLMTILTLAGLMALAMAMFMGRGAVVETAVAAPLTQAVGGVVSSEGVVEPLFFANHSFQIGGTVAEILVAEGDEVQAGDALVVLDMAQLQTAVTQAEARLVSVRANVDAVQNQLALAEAAVVIAQTRVEAAQAQLDLVNAGPLPAEIAAAEASLAAAEAGVSQAIGNRDARLDISNPSDIQQAEANVAQATAELRGLEDAYQNIIDTCFDTPDGEVCPLYGAVEESTRSQLEVARLNQEAAQAALDALRAGATPAQQQAANGAVSLAIANRDAAQAQLDLLLSGVTPEQVGVAEVALEQAQVGVEIAQANVAQTAAAVAQAEASVVAAETAVSAAKATLERATLRATFSGTVSQINVNPGELVGSGVPIVVMADFGTWLVRTTDLTELDIAQVQNGASASVRIDAIPDETLSATVEDIALVSSLSRGDVVYEVTLRLNGRSDLPLRWGMTAFVDIDTN